MKKQRWVKTGPIQQAYLNGDVTPYELCIKMFMEYFSDRVLSFGQIYSYTSVGNFCYNM